MARDLLFGAVTNYVEEAEPEAKKGTLDTAARG
jgi:hypothetical protein